MVQRKVLLLAWLRWGVALSTRNYDMSSPTETPELDESNTIWEKKYYELSYSGGHEAETVSSEDSNHLPRSGSGASSLEILYSGEHEAETVPGDDSNHLLSSGSGASSLKILYSGEHEAEIVSGDDSNHLSSSGSGASSLEALPVSVISVNPFEYFTYRFEEELVYDFPEIVYAPVPDLIHELPELSYDVVEIRNASAFRAGLNNSRHGDYNRFQVTQNQDSQNVTVGTDRHSSVVTGLCGYPPYNNKAKCRKQNYFKDPLYICQNAGGKAVFVAAAVLLGLCIVGANALLPIVVWKNTDMRTKYDFVKGSLAFADILKGLYSFSAP